MGAVEARGAPEQFPRILDEEARSFDLVMASDILYEEHHAVLLPSVIERYLRPGKHWVLSFAIRDAAMLMRFVRQLVVVGLLECVDPKENTADVDKKYKIALETGCVSSKCEFCSKQPEPERCEAETWSSEAIAVFAAPRLITMDDLWKVIEAHEGGGIMMEARRPL